MDLKHGPAVIFFLETGAALPREHDLQINRNNSGRFRSGGVGSIGKDVIMPDKETMRRAKRDKAQGKAPTTQAGEFIREEMEHIREGKHGAGSTKQAIAIGLSKARRAGVKLPPPKGGQTSEKTRQSAQRAYEAGQKEHSHPTSAKRSRAVTKALKREGHEAASTASLSKQARQQARKRTASQRSEIGKKAARTRLAHQSHAERSRIARKGARTRAGRSKST
jgi:Family of unknown function (DUF6496)